MFQIKGATYFQTPYEVMGKMYSNTMMMNLNSRMVSRYITDDAVVSNEVQLSQLTSPRLPVFANLQSGIMVTCEEHTDAKDSLEDRKYHYTNFLWC